ALGRAAARAPRNPVLIYGQAQRALEAGRSEDARRYLTRVAQLLAAGGAESGKAQSPFERVGLIRQAPGVAPIFPLARHEPAYAALAAHDFAAAVTAFEQAAAADPLGRSGGAAGEAIARAAAALREARTAEARRFAEAAVAAAPDDAEARRVLARVLWADE